MKRFLLLKDGRQCSTAVPNLFENAFRISRQGGRHHYKVAATGDGTKHTHKKKGDTEYKHTCRTSSRKYIMHKDGNQCGIQKMANGRMVLCSNPHHLTADSWVLFFFFKKKLYYFTTLPKKGQQKEQKYKQNTFSNFITFQRNMINYTTHSDCTSSKFSFL